MSENKAPSPLMIVLIGIVSIALFFGGYFMYKQYYPEGAEPNSSEKSVIEKFQDPQKVRIDKEIALINEVLEAQKKGQTAQDKFCSPSSVSTFYAVRSWEVVDGKEKGKTYTVRIESSTKGGMAINKLWKILVNEQNTLLCIDLIAEAQ